MDGHLPLWRRLRRRFWFLVARAVLAIVARVPEGAGRGLCRLLARGALRLRRQQRDQAWRNLVRVFPRRPEPWRRVLLRDAADALGDSAHAALTCLGTGAVAPVADLPGADGQTLVARLAGLQAAGRGALLVTAHLGCWELLAAWLARELGGAAVVTGQVHNAPVDRLLQQRRRALGLRILARDGGARPILRALDEGLIVGVLVDQNTRVASARLPFLGHDAPTPLGPARIAARRGVAMVPAALVRCEGRWCAIHDRPIIPADGDDPRDLAVRCNDALSEMVRRNPSQWVWFHDRWDDTAARPATGG
jgi:KDO2-lipid IV(A) lauroyltransferase